MLGRARWAFAGPGSPTYALRQWRDTGLPATLAGVVRRGGTLVLGSAAAVTLGAFAVPVYEVYKVGEDPEWVDALDLLRELTGLQAAVIPHYDNKEGGTHDTRFCYLGETRLAKLEEQLPDDVGVLGVDEHTAALLDIEARTLTVAGSGRVTVRRRGDSRTFAAGESVTFETIDALLRGDTAASSYIAPAPVDEANAPTATDDASTTLLSLGETADVAQAEFEEAFAAGDVERCVVVVLGLEQSIAEWHSDTLQSDDEPRARRALRAMVVRLGELAEAGADPRGQVAPVVELLLELRRSARDNGDFATSDLVRDRLSAAGIEVRDTPGGVDWQLAEQD